jgi:hypothetical protein
MASCIAILCNTSSMSSAIRDICHIHGTGCFARRHLPLLVVSCRLTVIAQLSAFNLYHSSITASFPFAR